MPSGWPEGSISSEVVNCAWPPAIQPDNAFHPLIPQHRLSTPGALTVRMFQIDDEGYMPITQVNHSFSATQ